MKATHINVSEPCRATDLIEPPIEGIGRDALVEGLRRAGHKQVVALDSREKLAETVAALARPGDLAVCMGAGSISAWAHALPGELERVFVKEELRYD